MTKSDAAMSSSYNKAICTRQITKEDYPEIRHTLVRAFEDDPVLNYTVRNDERRTQASHIFWSMTLDMTAPTEMQYMTVDGKGVALWAPGKIKLGFLAQLKMLPKIFSITGWSRFKRGLRTFGLMEKHHPKGPHYYLFVVGVDPDKQGLGYSSAVVRPILERCDVEGMGAYLESSNQKNVPLYEHWGFQVVETLHLGDKGDDEAPVLHTMWRKPAFAAQTTEPGKTQ